MLNHNILKMVALKSHSFRDLYQMRFLINFDNKVCEKWMINKIHKGLYELGIDAKEFIEKMIEGNAIMYGSFLSKTIFGLDPYYSRIDILLNGDRTDECDIEILLKSELPSNYKEHFQSLIDNRYVDIYDVNTIRDTRLYTYYNISNPFERYISLNSYFVDLHHRYGVRGNNVWEYLYRQNNIFFVYNDYEKRKDIMYDGRKIYMKGDHY